MFEHGFDIVVVGAGPAGIAAAWAAASSGAKVGVVDGNGAAGGQIWRHGAAAPPPRARQWVDKAEAAGVDFFSSTTVVDAASPNHLYAMCDDVPLCLSSDRLVLATGARERFLPFPGWTLPGVMGAGGLQALAKGGWPLSGKRVVVAGTGPLLLAVADGLRRHGARVVELVEQAGRAQVAQLAAPLLASPRKSAQAVRLAARLFGVRKRFRSWVLRAEGTASIETVVLHTPRGETRIDCDYLACGYGLVPDITIASFLGCVTERRGVAVDEMQRTNLPGVFAAGEITGIGGVDLALVEGQVAGFAAAGNSAAAASLLRRRRRERLFAAELEAAFDLRPQLRDLPEPETVVCRCEDVRWEQLRGFANARDAKLKTRCGMGVCQSRVCGPALDFLLEWGGDRIRPPFYPISVEALSAIGDATTMRRESERSAVVTL